MFLNGEKDRLASKNASLFIYKMHFSRSVISFYSFLLTEILRNQSSVYNMKEDYPSELSDFFVFVLIAEVKPSSAYHYHP